MSRALAFVVFGLLMSGCGTHPVTRTQTHRTTLADRNADFDRYVERRTESLQASGAFKDKAEAEAKAREEATHRYGEQIPEISGSWTWSSGGAGNRPLTLADYDKMVKDAKRR